MQTMNLLFAVDQHCITLLENCLFSIVKHGGYDHYDCYILHSDLNDTQIQHFLQFSDAITFHFVSVPENMFKGFPTVKRYPKQIYYRLAASELLPKTLNRILYLDVDTLIINPLSSIYELDFKDAWFLGCSNTQKFLTTFNQVRLGMKPDAECAYLNTGVLLMNLEAMREHVKISEIQQFVKEHKNQLFLPDQDILMALYGKHTRQIDPMIYNLSDRTLGAYNAQLKTEKRDLEWVKNNTVIIHYFGKNKPWKKGYHGVLKEFYTQMHSENN